MKAGIAQTDITPPEGCWLCGPLAPSTGTHDPLLARALVLDDGSASVAVLGLDLLCVAWDSFDEIINDFMWNEERIVVIWEGTRSLFRHDREAYMVWSSCLSLPKYERTWNDAPQHWATHIIVT